MCILKNRKTNAWSKNASKNSKREGWASSVKTFVMGRGVMDAGQVVKIECLKVKFEFSFFLWTVSELQWCCAICISKGLI